MKLVKTYQGKWLAVGIPDENPVTILSATWEVMQQRIQEHMKMDGPGCIREGDTIEITWDFDAGESWMKAKVLRTQNAMYVEGSTPEEALAALDKRIAATKDLIAKGEEAWDGIDTI